MLLQTNFSRVSAALDNFLCHQNSGQRYTIPNPATNNKKCSDEVQAHLYKSCASKSTLIGRGPCLMCVLHLNPANG